MLIEREHGSSQIRYDYAEICQDCQRPIVWHRYIQRYEDEKRDKQYDRNPRFVRCAECAAELFEKLKPQA